VDNSKVDVIIPHPSLTWWALLELYHGACSVAISHGVTVRSTAASSFTNHAYCADCVS